jgi:alkanesulfonate monooxygenase SsuD/methylene tetrahydromethanopterin reductase-like flavin-dependent oxidoreductase (luciferase family)
VFVNVGPDGDQARADTARRLGGMYAQDVTAMVDRVAAVGTTGQVTRRLCEFVDAGARHIILMPAGGSDDSDRMVNRLMDEVVPAVREYAR